MVRRMKPVRTTKNAASCVRAAKKPMELVSAAHFLQIANYYQFPSLSRTSYSVSGLAFRSASQKQFRAPCRETISLKLAV